MAESNHYVNVGLAGRLKKIQLETNPELNRQACNVFDAKAQPETNREATKWFDAKAMIASMIGQAQVLQRNFETDIFRLIGVRHIHGTNLQRILAQWRGCDELKKELLEMTRIYGICATALPYTITPTLNRICESVPHMSFVMACHINDTPGLAIRHWVHENELGAPVNYHFKMLYYPALLNVHHCSVKALAGFVLFNLCHARAIMNSSAKEEAATSTDAVAAFGISCRISSRIVADDLASRQSKELFTQFAETLPVTPELLNLVWRTVVGDQRIVLTTTTAVTGFHERIIKEQPLDLPKWRFLMEQN